MMKNLTIALLLIALMSCNAGNDEWIQLFNGSDLSGWIPKITGYPAGENYGNTFRVEDGTLKVSYDQYDELGGRFGHLFYKEPFSHYLLRIEYRFTGEQVNGGPAWAFRNSGVMIHAQSPESMAIDQDFPVSVEVQFLGGDGTNERSTGNVCTPGTHITMGDELISRHCTNSSSATYHGDQWVTAEIEVRGNELIRHIINGDTVISYSKPQLDERDPDAKALIDKGHPVMLEGGYIALQAESHPVEFRKVELKLLKDD